VGAAGSAAQNRTRLAQSRTQVRTRLRRPHAGLLSPAQLWKLTATHSLGDEEPERKKRKMEISILVLFYILSPGAQGTRLPSGPARVPAAVGRPPFRPPRSRSTVRGMTSLPPVRADAIAPLKLHPPWDDHPSAHPLKLRRPRDDQLPPSTLTQSPPRELRPPWGRPPIRPPSRDPPSAG